MKLVKIFEFMYNRYNHAVHHFLGLINVALVLLNFALTLANFALTSANINSATI